jgi:hypothetical protein
MATVYKETRNRVIGDDWNVDHTVTNTDENEVVTPVTGLTTATIVSSITNRDTGAILWTGTRAGGQITVTNDALGKISIAVPRATTATFTQRLYDMDVRVTGATTKVTPNRWYVQALKTSSP